MNYYPFNIGDYLAHTAHLSVVEDCAYRRLMDTYYLTERALPLDVKACSRLIRMREHETEVAAVLAEFFVETPGGWVQSRCDEEILRYQDKNDKAKASAAASVKSRQADVQRTFNGRSTDVDTNVELNKKQETRTNTPTDVGVSAPRKRSALAARPDEVSEPVWQDFQRLRAQKRSPLTDTALAGLRREADKAGLGLGDALAYCCEQGWQGFNAGWYAERTGKQARASPTSGKHAAAARAIYGAPSNPEFIDVETVVRQH